MLTVPMERRCGPRKFEGKELADGLESGFRPKEPFCPGRGGIGENSTAPRLKESTEIDFRPFIRLHGANRPWTVTHYDVRLAALMAVPALAHAPMETIRREQMTAFVSGHREKGSEISNMNQKLDVLRRLFELVMESEKLDKVLSIVRMLPGKNRRERFLTGEERSAYQTAAVTNSDDAVSA